MGTRAIIGYINDKGNVVGAWQWLDGEDLLPALRYYFNDMESINSLIQQGCWSILVTPKYVREYMNPSVMAERGYKLIPVNKCYILKYPHMNANNIADNKEIKVVNNTLVFRDIAVAFGQDINYLFLFNPITKKWKTFSSYRYSYKNLRDLCKKVPPSEHKDFFFKL